MRYVQRNDEGHVIAHFANEQPYAKELLPADHSDIKAFRARAEYRQKPSTSIRVDATVIGSPFARGLIRALAKRFKISETALIEEIKNEAGPQMEPDAKGAAIEALFEREKKSGKVI